MPGQGIPLGDILDDCSYSHRDAGAWAIPLRAAGAQLVQDLHPHDRGPKGTHDGAIISNGKGVPFLISRPCLTDGAITVRVSLLSARAVDGSHRARPVPAEGAISSKRVAVAEVRPACILAPVSGGHGVTVASSDVHVGGIMQE
jgi:hypothetical protein